MQNYTELSLTSCIGPSFECSINNFGRVSMSMGTLHRLEMPTRCPWFCITQTPECPHKPIPNSLCCFNPIITRFYLPKDCCQTLPGNSGVGNLTVMSRQIAPSLFDIMNQLRLEVWMTPNGLHNTHLAKFAVSLPVFPSSLLLETQPTRPKFSIMFSLLCLSLICSIIVATTISGFSLDLNLHIISIVH